MLKAVIFDMDGVLVDTEPLYEQHRIAYLKKIGHDLGSEFFETHRATLGGTTARRYWEFMSQHIKLEKTIEELIEHSRNDYLEFLMSLPNLAPNPGVVDLINRLSEIPLAVASSASLRRIKTILQIFKIEDKFKIIVCGDDVSRSKPAPDIYLKAAELLKLDPKECVVIEDVTNGVKSAKAAGMKVVGYAGAPHNTQDLSKADLIINNFSELNNNKLSELYQ